MQVNNINFKVGIVGLGYVGLPLAIEFGKKFHTRKAYSESFRMLLEKILN